MKFISLSTIIGRKEYLAKIKNLPKRHGVGPNAAVSVASA